MERKALISELCKISDTLTGGPGVGRHWDETVPPNPMLAATQLGFLRGLLAAEEEEAKPDQDPPGDEPGR